MRVVTYYSHLNGLEFLQVHKPGLWAEILDVIARLDAETCRTKVSKEIRTKDKGVAATKMRDQIKKAERKAKREERE